MPIYPTYLTTIWELTDAVTTKLEEEAGPLGLEYVGSYDEKRIPRYPAAITAPGQRQKTIAGVEKFDIEFSVDIWVYHAELTETHTVRSRKDLQLVSAIEEAIETGYPTAPLLKDYTLGGAVVFGFIQSQIPGLIQPRSSKTEVVVGTRMEWVAISRKGFGKYGP